MTFEKARTNNNNSNVRKGKQKGRSEHHYELFKNKKKKVRWSLTWTNSNYSKARKGMWRRGILKPSTNVQKQGKESENKEAQISSNYYSSPQRGGSLNNQQLFFKSKN